ncbi:hypothetical protein EVAR_88046_1 [Eumeta japonica]|uniref:Uncharacterized protein n=1 Tax=Eumeta variegata TaxID=151549 RepID=A0A4C1VCG0_EUMVA|nr:hypothetical protein EVAR_88046_1 [Eumeta japonica]
MDADNRESGHKAGTRHLQELQHLRRPFPLAHDGERPPNEIRRPRLRVSPDSSTSPKHCAPTQTHDSVNARSIQTDDVRLRDNFAQTDHVELLIKYVDSVHDADV